MMGQASDDLDSSDDEDHFPPSQVFINNDRGAQPMANNGKVNTSKAGKFDQLLKVSKMPLHHNALQFSLLSLLNEIERYEYSRARRCQAAERFLI